MCQTPVWQTCINHVSSRCAMYNVQKHYTMILCGRDPSSRVKSATVLSLQHRPLTPDWTVHITAYRTSMIFTRYSVLLTLLLWISLLCMRKYDEYSKSCGSLQNKTLQPSAVQCTVPLSAVQCSAMHCTVKCSAVQCIVQLSAVQCTVEKSAVQCRSLQWRCLTQSWRWP